VRLKKTLDLPGLATNDLHYTFPEDAKPHEVLLCVQTGKTMSDPNRFKFDAQDFYLKSPAQMREQWDGEFPEACDNTLRIAERVHVEFTEGRDLMPRFPVPAGESEASWLVKEVERGLRQRFPDCYAFSLANGKGQSFIGASPELLVRRSGASDLTGAPPPTVP